MGRNNIQQISEERKLNIDAGKVLRLDTNDTAYYFRLSRKAFQAWVREKPQLYRLALRHSGNGELFFFYADLLEYSKETTVELRGELLFI